jgi:hypothetical protein
MEHKPWIDRIRFHFPDFALIPADLPEEEGEDDLDPEERKMIEAYIESMDDDPDSEADFWDHFLDTDSYDEYYYAMDYLMPDPGPDLELAWEGS